MPDQNEKRDGTSSMAQGKRDGRESPDERNQPEEYVDEMRVNRFTPPPPPKQKDEE